MAMEFCSECGKERSDKAETCPHCGIAVPVKKNKLITPIFWIAIVSLFLIIKSCDSSKSATSAADSSPKSGADEIGHGHQPVDISLPIYTEAISDDGYGAMVCPSSLLYDQRVGHGVQALYEAKGSVFSHSEKVAAVGCEELKGGIPVYFDPDELKRIAELQLSGKVAFVYVQFSQGFQVSKVIYSGDLTNNPSGKYGEPYSPTKIEVPQSTKFDAPLASVSEHPIDELKSQGSISQQLEPVSPSSAAGLNLSQRSSEPSLTKIWEPSFNCYSTLTATEKAICSDSTLSLMDKMMTFQYKLGLKNSTNPELYKKSQSDWRGNERNACKDNLPCLLAVYKAKLANFSNPGVLSFMAANNWTLKSQIWKKPDSCSQLFIHDGSELTVVYKCETGSFSDLIVSN